MSRLSFWMIAGIDYLTPSKENDRALMQALDYAAQRGVIAVVAAGDEGIVGSALMVRQPWMIAVTACDVTGGRSGTRTSATRLVDAD